MKIIRYEFVFPDTANWEKHEKVIQKRVDKLVKSILPQYPSLLFRKVYDERWRWRNPEDNL